MRLRGSVPSVVAALFVLPLLLAAFESIFLPYGLDQGWFARVSDVILQGGMPYRDAWEVKSPATHYLFALAELVFGRSTRSIRIVDLLFLVGALAAFYRLARREGQLAALVACVLFASLHLRLGYSGSAQPDPWAAMLIVIALAIVPLRDANAREAGGEGGARAPSVGVLRAAAAGAMIGLAGLLKLPLIALGGPVALAAWSDRSGRARVGAIVWLGVGALAPIVLCLAWFASQDGLGALLEVQLGFNREVHSGKISLSATTHLLRLGQIFLDPVRALLLPFVALGVYRLSQKRVPMLWVLLVWLVIGAGLLVLQARYYGYQPSILHPALVLLASAGFAELSERAGAFALRLRRPEWTGDFVVALVVGAVLAFALPPIKTMAVETYVLGHKRPIVHLRSFGEGAWAPLTLYQLASELERRSDPEDEIFIWGLAPGVHYLSERASPSRFASAYPLVTGAEQDYRARYRAEFMRSIEARPPRFIVVATRDVNTFYDRNSWEHFLAFTAFRELVESRYTPAGGFAHFRIYERREPDASS